MSEIKTPVWQALAALSWLKDIVTGEVLQPGSKVCDMNIKGGQDIAKWAKVGVSTMQGIDKSQNNVAKAKDMVKGFKKHQMVAQFDVFDVFRGNIRDLLPPSTFDCVASFNDTHLMMESAETAQCFFSNASYVLKPNGYVVLLLHDGAAIWSLVQKETPEGDLPEDFKPTVKRKLFSIEMVDILGAKHKNPKVTGVTYRLHVKKEGGLEPGAVVLSFQEGFLINNRELIASAAGNGLHMLHMVNCGDLMDDYAPLYPETMKKKLVQAMSKEQREVVQLFAFAVFQKK